MDELWWPLLWTIAGLPIISSATKYNLLRKASKDYAYYLESKALSIGKLGVSKLGFFLGTGLALTVFSFPAEKMVVALLVVAVCGGLLESTVLIGRPHPTPEYTPMDLVCTGCRSNEHDSCSNLRMLDSFESNFVSKEGRRRPICCCGFRISTLRVLGL